jgi:DNA-binding XRE family transcriptional regulator
MPRQNTSPADYPQAVLQQIEQLAQNIVIARKRRGESQAQWAQKLGISQPTMARIERGDPSVAMASYVMCMWLINQAGGLADLIAPQNDHAALEKEVAKVKIKRKPTAKQTQVLKPASIDALVLGTPQIVEATLTTSPAAAGLAALMNKLVPQKP